MDDTANLKLPYIMAAQAQKHVTHNEAIRALDAIVQLMALDRDLTVPPASPVDGDRYIVAAGSTGAWAGFDTQIAAYQDNAWAFYPPVEGWLAWIADEDKLLAWDGAAWTEVSSGGGGGVASLNPATGGLVGVNATADVTNRLSVSSPASLFNHEGAGHQIKVNKNAAADTASFLFQTGFSGRAEIGLTGDDDFRFKVSPDGTTFFEGIVIDKDTGAVSFPNTTLSGTGDVVGPASATNNAAARFDTATGKLLQNSLVSIGDTGDVSTPGDIASSGSGPRFVSAVSTDDNAALFADVPVGKVSFVELRRAGVVRFRWALDTANNVAATLYNASGAITFTPFSIDATTGLSTVPGDAVDPLGIVTKQQLEATGSGRETLTADRTYFVRTDGNDSNDGLTNSAGGAFLTLQKAYDVIAGTLDLGGNTVTVQVGNGTYTSQLAIVGPWTGGGAVTFKGDTTTPSNVLIAITTAATDCVLITAALPGILTIEGFKLTGVGAQDLIQHRGGGTLDLGVNEYGDAARFQIFSNNNSARIQMYSDYTISGGAFSHLTANGASYLTFGDAAGRTVTITGTPNFLLGFAFATRLSLIEQIGGTWSGSATGPEYAVDANAVLYKLGITLPGDAAGTTATGGQVV